MRDGTGGDGGCLWRGKEKNKRYLGPGTVMCPVRANRIMKTLSFLSLPHNSPWLNVHVPFFQQSLCLDPTDVLRVNSGLYTSYFKEHFPEALPSTFSAGGPTTCSQHSLCLLESSQDFLPAHMQPHKWGFIVKPILTVWCHTGQLLCILNIIPYQSF